MIIKFIPKDKHATAISVAAKVFARLDPILQQDEGFSELSVIAEEDDMFVLSANPKISKKILDYIIELENEFNFAIEVMVE